VDGDEEQREAAFGAAHLLQDLLEECLACGRRHRPVESAPGEHVGAVELGLCGGSAQVLGDERIDARNEGSPLAVADRKAAEHEMGA